MEASTKTNSSQTTRKKKKHKHNLSTNQNDHVDVDWKPVATFLLWHTAVIGLYLWMLHSGVGEKTLSFCKVLASQMRILYKDSEFSISPLHPRVGIMIVMGVLYYIKSIFMAFFVVIHHFGVIDAILASSIKGVAIIAIGIAGTIRESPISVVDYLAVLIFIVSFAGKIFTEFEDGSLKLSLICECGLFTSWTLATSHTRLAIIPFVLFVVYFLKTRYETQLENSDTTLKED